MQITLKVRAKNLDKFRLSRQMDFNIEGMHGTARVTRIDRKPVDVTRFGDATQQYVLSEYADVTLAVDGFVDQPLGGVRPGDIVTREGDNVYVNGLLLTREEVRDAKFDTIKIEGEGFLKAALDESRKKITSTMTKTIEQMAKEFVEGTYHPNCRCTPVGLTTQKEKPVKKVKFYIGKPDVCEGRDYSQWGKATLPEVIEQAKKVCEETGQPQYIVKVIKVVRKKAQPVVVEDVK